jgi:hypothetical protein
MANETPSPVHHVLWLTRVHRPISGLTGISDLDRQAAEIIRQGLKYVT